MGPEITCDNSSSGTPFADLNDCLAARAEMSRVQRDHDHNVFARCQYVLIDDRELSRLRRDPSSSVLHPHAKDPPPASCREGVNVAQHSK
jgi:hypothetical protein